MGDDFPPFFVCYYVVTIIRYSTGHAHELPLTPLGLRQKGRGKSLLEGRLLGSKVAQPPVITQFNQPSSVKRGVRSLKGGYR